MAEEGKGNLSYFDEVESLESIAAVKSAVFLCNHPQLKREILCGKGSSYEMAKKQDIHSRKELWNNIIERKATEILEKIGLAKRLQERVICIVLAVGMRMLTWAEYHEGTVKLLREYSINFLNSSLFTEQGIIDNKKAAEEIIKDESLSIKQKYKLACLHFLTDSITALFSQLTNRDKKNLMRNVCVGAPRIEEFWCFYLMGEIYKLKSNKSLEELRLQKAAECGSKAAVEYCLEMTHLSKEKKTMVNAAVKIVELRKKALNDWLVFNTERYNDDNRQKIWVPNDYYIDVLCFLLSKMGKEEKIEFLKKFFGNPYNRTDYSTMPDGYVILEYFLNWPFQKYFVPMAKLMMECSPDEAYALPQIKYFNLFLKIFDKMEPRREHNLKYGEEKICDYTKLLKEFWHETPERYKRYVFKFGLRLLAKYLRLKNFTPSDGKNIKLILDSATDEEKKNIISSREGKEICVWLLKEGKLEILDLFVRNYFSSCVQADEFKRVFSCTWEVQSVMIYVVKYRKWDVAESFIEWSALPEEGKKQLKRDIYSKGGQHACLYLISCNQFEVIDKFVRWGFPSEAEVIAFKKKLIFSRLGLFQCARLVTENPIKLEEFINLCLPPEEEIAEFKKKVGYRTAATVLEDLISAYSKQKVCYNYLVSDYYVVLHLNVFKGGKWEEVEQYMTWCFSSEQEIHTFKQSCLREAIGATVHFNLIKCNKWNEAETFFAWLGLSPEDIKKLKKETLFYHKPAEEMFVKLMFIDEDTEEFEEFAVYGSKEEALELLLRWYLTDKETVLEFKDKFRSLFDGGLSQERKLCLKCLI